MKIAGLLLTEPLYSEKFLAKLNKPRRLADVPIDGYYKDIAKSAQVHLEKVAFVSFEISLRQDIFNKSLSCRRSSSQCSDESKIIGIWICQQYSPYKCSRR